MSTAIAELKRQVQERQRELAKLQGLVTRMAVIQKELATLESALAILDPKRTHTAIISTVQKSNTISIVGRSSMSTPQSVHAVLKEAGKPLTLREIHPLILAIGKQVSFSTMTSAIYDAIKKGKLFKKFGAGRIGLLEWPDMQ